MKFLASAEKTVFTAYSYSRPDLHQSRVIPTLFYTPDQQSHAVQAITFHDKCKAFADTLFPHPRVDFMDKRGGN